MEIKMGLSRDLLRVEAKRLYKEQNKGVPKKSRMPFTEFYKQFKRMKAGKAIEEEHDHSGHDHSHDAPQDFDVSQVASINKVENPTANQAPTPTNIRRTGHK
jgi:hypothetical protein